jgi:hypothetical protein
MAFNSADWTIDYTNKTIGNDDSGVGNNLPSALGDYSKIGSVLEFFQWLAAEFAATGQMDDLYPIQSDTPTVFKFLNGWTWETPEEDFKYLDGGSIEDPAGSGTATADSLWSNLYSIGSQTNGTQLYMIQNGAEVTPWWITGNIDILVLVKDTGAWIQSNDTGGTPTNGGLWIYARETGDLYDHNFANIAGGGANPIGINTAQDGNNGSGELYLSVTSATGFTVGKFVEGQTSGAVGKIVSIDSNDIYLNAVRAGIDSGATATFVISETLTEYSDREGQTATGQSTTNDGTTAFTNVVAGYDAAFTETFGAITRDLDNGDGLQNYSVEIDGNGSTMKQFYEWLKYLTRYTSTTQVNSEVKVAPFGTLAGSTFYGAQGVWVTDYAVADFVLRDDEYDQQIPPSYQNVICSHPSLSGCNILVACRTGASLIKNQYTFNLAGSNATTIAVNEALDASKIPAPAGVVRIGDTRYAYTAVDITAKEFTVSVDPTGETNGADLYIPLLDVLADATSEASNNVIYSASFDVRTSVRKYGFKPYDVDTSFGASGLDFTPILATTGYLMESEITYVKAANWATLSGMFTPGELREIADTIEDKFSEFKENQSGNKDGLHD